MPGDLTRWRDKAVAELRVAGAELPDGGLWQADEAARVMIRAHAVTESCPTRFLADRATPFVWRPAMVARTLAAETLKELAEQGSTAVVPASRRAIELATQSADTMADWLAGLDDGGRSQVLRATVTLASAFLEFLQGDWPPDRAQFGVQRARVQVPGKPIGLDARFEHTRPARAGTSNKILTILHGGGVLDERVLAHTALCWVASDRGATLTRVRAVSASRGTMQTLDVTDDVLDRALARAVEIVGWAAQDVAGVDVDPIANHRCPHCPYLAHCATGQAQVSDPSRRVGGLPITLD